MARNILTSRLPRLKELRQARAPEALAREVQRMAKQLNQRLYRLEKRGIGRHEAAYVFAQEYTGKEKPRYDVNLERIKEMSLNELYQYGLELNAGLTAESSTIKGVMNIQEKRSIAREKALRERGIDIDRNEFDEFLRNGGGEFLNSVKKYLSSDQVIEMWSDYHGQLDAQEFIDAFYSEKQRRERHKVSTIYKDLRKRSRKRGK